MAHGAEEEGGIQLVLVGLCTVTGGAGPVLVPRSLPCVSPWFHTSPALSSASVCSTR